MSYIYIRLACSFLSGVLFSQAGSLIQMGTRNILASPSTLGFDGLSVFWLLIMHSISLYFGWENQSITLIILAGIPFFILLGLLFTQALTKHQKLERIILLGLSFNLFVGAIFSLWQFLFTAFNLPFPMELWFGHFRYADIHTLFFIFLTEAIILSVLYFYKKEFILFSLGTGIFKNFHLKVHHINKLIFISVAVVTFILTSLFGTFSYLGLFFPLMARKIWFKGHGLKGELILGGMMNGFILMLMDLLCYQFPIYGAEIPVGLIMTGIGAVSLILLFWKSYNHREILANSNN